MISRIAGCPVQISLDIEDYRARQEKKLIEMAQHAAQEVQRTGKEYEFMPMSARERRIIHTALQSTPQIETISQGEDKERHLIVRYRSSLATDISADQKN
jgi:spoIIIJ-associated protein